MRKSLKRITALALSACMVGAMAGCGNGDSGTTAAPKDNTTAAQEKPLPEERRQLQRQKAEIQKNR